MEEFQLSKFTNEGAKLLRDVTAEFKRFKLDESKLPKVFPDDDGKIKLVFVGQFSAGKSSIIKMLTGVEDIEIGAKITTQKSTSYDWNGLEIVDTPGILTELRPDHDEVTYDQINHAALLIFVITSEGFSQRIANHFRDLAIKQQRAGNMVLVVNKMDQTAQGNESDQQEIIYEDLKKVTEPYDPKDLYVTFLDTSAYFESLTESDAEYKADLLDLSGYDVFVENLNRFVADKGFLQKINTPLNTIAASLRSALSDAELSKDKDVTALIGTLEHKKEIFLDGKKNCMTDIKEIASQCKADIINEGYGASQLIQPQNLKEEGDDVKINRAIHAAQENVAKIVDKHRQRADKCLIDSLKEIGADIQNYDNQDFVKRINLNVTQKVSVAQENSHGTEIGAALTGIGAVLTKFANPAAVAVGTPTAFAEFAGIAAGAGTEFALGTTLGPLSKVVSGATGVFVTKILTPNPTLFQQSMAFVSRNLGAILGIASAAYTVYSTVKQNEEVRQREEKFRQERENVDKKFYEIANDVYEKILDSYKKILDEGINPIIAEIDDGIQKIYDEQKRAELQGETLKKLLKRTENLIGEIQACR